ncbi:hypothetical protein ANCCEY_07692 [Ancylostoma ceylanicum]|uniref:Uncharacterized protein n=1 Tax=Ancylostoma ceylanicum TaxID=53326 RepID=A0A0D6LT50_9BILA|nr:hypothetical protein ANCCEY_07692 [Ancylostoma ceylanicum]
MAWIPRFRGFDSKERRMGSSGLSQEDVLLGSHHPEGAVQYAAIVPLDGLITQFHLQPEILVRLSKCNKKRAACDLHECMREVHLESEKWAGPKMDTEPEFAQGGGVKCFQKKLRELRAKRVHYSKCSRKQRVTKLRS